MNTSLYKYSKSQPKAGKYLLKTGSKMKLYQIMYLLWEQYSNIKRLQTPPKAKLHEENCDKVDRTSELTTENIAAESILCANLCWQLYLINEHVSKQIQQGPAQGRKVLVEKRQKNESCIRLCTCSKNNVAQKQRCKRSQNKTTWRKLPQSGWDKPNHYRKHCNGIHCVQMCWQP